MNETVLIADADLRTRKSPEGILCHIANPKTADTRYPTVMCGATIGFGKTQTMTEITIDLAAAFKLHRCTPCIEQGIAVLAELREESIQKISDEFGEALAKLKGRRTP